jgi:hypothetical protein
MTELIFGTCPRCGEQYPLTSEHVCYHRMADPVARMYHCVHCGGDYPVGQSHGCVTIEAETVELLRRISRDVEQLRLRLT